MKMKELLVLLYRITFVMRKKILYCINNTNSKKYTKMHDTNKSFSKSMKFIHYIKILLKTLLLMLMCILFLLSRQIFENKIKFLLSLHYKHLQYLY